MFGVGSQFIRDKFPKFEDHRLPDTVEDVRTTSFAVQQAGLVKHCEVLGNHWLRELELIYELTYCVGLFSETLQDSEPIDVAKDFEEAGDRFHM